MSSYKVGLSGESNYQPAIRACRPGQRVRVVHEPDNPYDDEALAVESESGATIGYVPRSSWLREAIHEEGKGCTATILSLDQSAGEALGVVIDVVLNANGVSERPYRPAR